MAGDLPWVLLVSGPIRKHLWKANLGLLISIGLCVAISLLLANEDRVQRLGWAFPVRGQWLRYFLKGLLVANVLFCLFVLATSGLGFLAVFPFLAM
jgi:hypothetical protein